MIRPEIESLSRKGYGRLTPETDVTYLYPSTKRGIRALPLNFHSDPPTVYVGENGTGKNYARKSPCRSRSSREASSPEAGNIFPVKGTPLLSYFVIQDVDYRLYAGGVADEVVLGRQVDDASRARAWALTALV